MALTATIYNLLIELADIDRAVYATIDLRVARQPSESSEYMLVRVLAYCLEYTEGIALTQGVAAGDEPAVWVRDLTGKLTAWIEVGLPSAERLHRGSRAAGRVAVYTHRDVTQFLAQLSGQKIHRAEQIPIYSLDRRVVEELAGVIDRRTSMTITVSERQLYVNVSERTLICALTEHRIGKRTP